MRSVALIPFERAHLERFEPGRFDREVLEEPYVGVLLRAWPGRAVSAEHDDRILGIAGASIVQSCAYPWMALSDEMRRHFPVLLTKLARRALQSFFEIDGATSIEVSARSEFTASGRWLERLGFHAVGQGNDRMRYVRY